GNRAGAGTAAAVRSRERLVKIELQHVGAHVARLGDAHERVHVRAVHVDEAALVVHDGGDLLDVFLEKTERVRIGHHERGDVFVHALANGCGREQAARIARYRYAV